MIKHRNALFAAALLAIPMTASAPAFAGDVDPQSVFSAIASSEESSSAIRKATKVGAVEVVEVSALAHDGSRLETTILKNQSRIEEVQAALQSNATLNSALEAKEIDPTQVVAANLDSGGTLTVYVK